MMKKKALDSAVGEILFSDNTYQVEVKDKQIYWPLLQIADDGTLLDSICSCSEPSPCSHSLAAYAKILNSSKIPLHIRFKHSLWRQIGKICSLRYGYIPDKKQIKEASFTAFSPTGKKLFALKALNKEGKEEFRKILVNRAPKDESNSLEFSNRSAEEMQLWREKRPTHDLQFALSFWNDLAKWWMRLQEEGHLASLSFEGEMLPKALKIQFLQVEVYFYVAEANWQTIIPTLNGVPSSLKVFGQERGVTTHLRYDPQKKGFYVIKKPGLKKPQGRQEIPVGAWIFVPTEGFYPSLTDPVFAKSFIEKDEVPDLLNLHTKEASKMLENASILEEVHTAHYQLFFDEMQRLHIRLYVFTPGDLSSDAAALFEDWAFVPPSKFVELSDAKFPHKEAIIAKEEMVDFIAENKAWLSDQKGFEIHVSSLEAQLSYSMDQQGLQFFRAMETPGFSEGVIDFGSVVYVQGKGFFYKKTSDIAALLKPGLKVASKDISHFILRNKEELQNIPLFFAKTCPIQGAKLHIHLDEKERLVINPHYELLEGYKEENLKLFGNFAYVEGEGFSEIPKNLMVPEEFQKEKIIPAYEVKIFLQNTLPEIISIAVLDPKLKPFEECQLLVESLSQEEEKGKWRFGLQYSSELGNTSLYEVWKAIKQRKPYAFTSAGLFDLSEDRFQWLLHLSEEMFDSQGVHLTTLDWYKMKLHDEPHLGPACENSPSARELFEQLQALQPKEILNLTSLKSSLRVYQETGVKWLFSLYELGLSGLLCDEMGLGKTHQAMGLLAASLSAAQKGNRFLIVCPTSVLYHWEDQLRRFLPDMPLLVFYGANRSLAEFTQGVLLTSYGVLRSEFKSIATMKFDIAVLDELQVAKNPSSKTHRCLKQIQAGMRVGLSGTPIENRLEELKALFDIILPNFLPKPEAFREEFVYPIEKHADVAAQQKLQKMIRPFLLRRRKQEVLKELPEKVEEIAYCSLSEEQKKLYVEAVAGSKKRLLNEMQEKQSGSFLHIFALLTQLKRICDHPCLITKEKPSFSKIQSGKWELFTQLLAEARESGQKVVVFSQYLEMLDIIEEYLQQQGILYASVRGSTQNRRAQIEKFQKDPAIEVFVASLQAVGVGIDLTAGSVVIHYDRWWNPAKENQATDRVHRIGQNRGVQVFKMVTKGTLEERIHELIERKKTLSREVLPHDDEEELRTLSKEELLSILLTLEENPEKLGPSLEE